MELEGNLVLERRPARRWVSAVAVIVPVLACLAGVTWFVRAYISPPTIAIPSPMSTGRRASRACRAGGAAGRRAARQATETAGAAPSPPCSKPLGVAANVRDARGSAVVSACAVRASP